MVKADLKKTIEDIESGKRKPREYPEQPTSVNFSKNFLKSVQWIIETAEPDQQHREYLKLFSDKGLRFSWSVNESKNEWLENYTDKKFEPRINLIERLPHVLVIEFDEPLTEDGMKPKLALIKTEKELKKQGLAYMRSSHQGKCDYLWLESGSAISEADAKRFLAWICPEGARIDTNFASSIKVFPVLFAPHRKYPHNETPLYIRPGKKLNLSRLQLPKVAPKTQKVKTETGFIYETFQDSQNQEDKVSFGFESVKSEVKDLAELEEVIKTNFPSDWFETRACASVFASLSLKNLNGCPSLNLVGSPSGEKTTVLSFFYDHDLSYISDDFTPRAFVSHSANVAKEDLEDVDLLPKIKNKVLISPELAPLFEAPRDKLLDNFAILTRVLDGEGLNRDSGVHGHRGYSGDYKFAWLGATTPLRAGVWNIMGKIGNRLFFLNMRDKNRKQEDYIEMFRSKAYEEKVKICRGAVKSFLENHFKKYPVRSLEWDAEQDVFVLQEIVKYAQLLARLRGTLMLWKEESSEGKKSYQYSFPIIEEPPRAINSLFNLAKGHALIHGRTFLKSEDLEVVRAVAFSSMPHDRFQFLKLLIDHEGKLTTQNIQNELICSDETARKTMKIFEVLGVVDKKSLDGGFGRPMDYVEIKTEFFEILTSTQVLKDLEKPIPSENKGASDEFSAEKFVKMEKNLKKTQHTHPGNGLEKPIPRQTNPVQADFSEKNEFDEVLK